METVIDPSRWPATQVATAIARRELSAREYLDLLLRRIAAHNPALNAVVSVDDRAERWAKAADDATARGESYGPLHGVAMTVKDSLNTAGLRTTAGATALSRHVPGEDAEAVRALRRAGAIVFGKTNLAANCMDVQTSNDVFGVSRNPWDPSRTPGGSSGGAAAAVAAGFTAAELGSDIAGSIRIPASNCGVFGHKPSFGVVPVAGHIPPYQPTRPDLAVVGPLARDVEDLRLLLTVIAGPDPLDRPAWRLNLPPPQPLRTVALWSDDPYCPVARDVRDAVERAGSALARTGIVVEPDAPAGVSLEANDEIMRRSLATAALAAHAAPASAEATAQLGGEYAAQSHHDWLRAQDRRARIQRAWHRFFKRYDAILLPVSVRPAIAHDARPFAERRISVDGIERPYWDQIVWAGLAGVAHLPVTVVPVGIGSCGTPIGVAVTGPYLGDLTTLALAQRLAGSLGGVGVPPIATL